MEEIKIGEYIRFKDGKIRKIINQDVDNHLIVDTYIYGGNWLTLNEQENILKHSFNIIDLVEVGDYVNGHKVVFVDDCEGYMKEIYCEDDENFGIWEEMITSILTKEQFENIEYKVEE